MVSLRDAFLKTFNSILEAVKFMYPTWTLNIDSSNEEASQQLNGLFMSYELQGIIEEKDDWSLNKVLSFVAAFLSWLYLNFRET